MSINWVIRQPGEIPFVPLPEEYIRCKFYRVSFSLKSGNEFPGNQNTCYESASGSLFLTSSRIIYLPEKETTHFKSFNSPLQNIHNSNISQPWFGPNQWLADIAPVAQGGLDCGCSLALTFKDGGTFDFASSYDLLRENVRSGADYDLPPYEP